MNLNELAAHRTELLRSIVDMNDAGLAEAASESFVLRRFLPLAEYGRVLEPDCLLVIGNRGAGKTQIFRAIQQEEGRQAIQEVAPRVDSGRLLRSDWIVGFSTEGNLFPSDFSWSQLIASGSALDLQQVWCALFLRVVATSAQSALLPPLPEKIAPIRDTNSNRLTELLRVFSENIEEAMSWLDGADEELLKNDRWLFVTYDELDRITGTTWEDYQGIVRGLLQFWSHYSRRYRRLRPKIFLRRDLFERALLLGSDISKLNAKRVELTWTPRNLYAMLAKRMFNEPGLLPEYFEGVAPAGRQEGALGWYPTSSDVEEFKPMVDRLIGSFMGKYHRKGMTFGWLPNHCMDANGLILPRSFVRLVGYAADQELQSPRAQSPRLLHPTSFRVSMDRVSDERVQELGEEFGWMAQVQVHLKSAQLQVPIGKTSLEEVLNLPWPDPKQRPPEVSGNGLLRYLSMLGVFYEIPDGRINVRDIYLKGFGFKRRGGVARSL